MGWNSSAKISSFPASSRGRRRATRAVTAMSCSPRAAGATGARRTLPPKGPCGPVRASSPLAAIEPVIAAAAARLPECCLLPCPKGADGGISAGAAAELLAAREKAGVLLMGPGMGNTSDTRALVRALVDGAACTVVLDADGLNAAAALLAAGEALPRPAGSLILTPHPGGDGPPDRPFRWPRSRPTGPAWPRSTPGLGAAPLCSKGTAPSWLRPTAACGGTPPAMPALPGAAAGTCWPA